MAIREEDLQEVAICHGAFDLPQLEVSSFDETGLQVKGSWYGRKGCRPSSWNSTAGLVSYKQEEAAEEAWQWYHQILSQAEPEEPLPE